MMDWEYAEEIFAKAIDRMRGIGLTDYGNFNPATDPRNMCGEAKEEVLDVVVYAGFLYRKIEALEKKYEQIKRKIEEEEHGRIENHEQ